MAVVQQEVAVIHHNHLQEDRVIHHHPYGVPWYPLPAPLRKSLPYPTYEQGSDPDSHMRVFETTVRANRENDAAETINLFGFTLRDKISEWYANYLNSHPYTNFEELKQAFCKRYRKV